MLAHTNIHRGNLEILILLHLEGYERAYWKYIFDYILYRIRYTPVLPLFFLLF